MMRKPIAILFTVVATCMGIATSVEAAAVKKYFTYDTFKAITATCPELKHPVLAGLEPAGQDLWAKGQMRMPAETHLFEGDFNNDHQKDAAFCVTDGGKSYAVIAQFAGGKWTKAGCVALPRNQKISEFNSRALVVGDKTFVAWNGSRYRVERGPLAEYCYGYQDSDLGAVVVKLTYVGSQDEPYPGLMISSFYHVPNIAQFKQHRRAGVSYSNDDHPVMWHLTVAPKTLRTFACALACSDFIAQAEDRKGNEAVAHSFSMLDESSASRPNYFEVFLKSNESVQLLKKCAASCSASDADGAKLLKDYAKMFGP